MFEPDYEVGKTPFPNVLYSLLERGTYRTLMDWSSDNTFLIYDTERFSSEVLPRLFGHPNFSSFVRLLNSYAFKRTKNNRSECEYRHPVFIRGRNDLLPHITRKNANFFKAFTNQAGENYPPLAFDQATKIAEAATAQGQVNVASVLGGEGGGAGAGAGAGGAGAGSRPASSGSPFQPSQGAGAGFVPASTSVPQGQEDDVMEDDTDPSSEEQEELAAAATLATLPSHTPAPPQPANASSSSTSTAETVMALLGQIGSQLPPHTVRELQQFAQQQQMMSNPASRMGAGSAPGNLQSQVPTVGTNRGTTASPSGLFGNDAQTASFPPLAPPPPLPFPGANFPAPPPNLPAMAPNLPPHLQQQLQLLAQRNMAQAQGVHNSSNNNSSSNNNGGPTPALFAPSAQVQSTPTLFTAQGSNGSLHTATRGPFSAPMGANGPLFSQASPGMLLQDPSQLQQSQGQGMVTLQVPASVAGTLQALLNAMNGGNALAGMAQAQSAQPFTLNTVPLQAANLVALPPNFSLHAAQGMALNGAPFGALNMTLGGVSIPLTGPMGPPGAIPSHVNGTGNAPSEVQRKV